MSRTAFRIDGIVLALAALSAVAFAQESGAPAVPSAPATLPMAPTASTAGQNPFLGGVPSGTATDQVVTLTLGEAVARGLEHNLGARLGQESLRSAEANLRLARSGLLPSLTGRVGASRQEIDLEAYGFPVAPGESPVVGPFNVLDLRLYGNVAVFDPATLARWRAGSESVTGARAGLADAREQVVVTCAMLYLQAATALARIDASKSEFAAAEALYRRAVDLKGAGVVPGIEVLRADVQRQAQRQRVIFYENDYAKQKLALARAIGMPLAQRFELADRVPYKPLTGFAVDTALNDAYAARPDLQALESQVRAAESIRRADIAEGLPSVRLSADVGKIGPTRDSLERTFSVGAGLAIPIFEGGRVRARVAAATAALDEARARRDDLRNRVEYDVRSAFLDVTSADERVGVAKGALDLAQQTEAQAQDRFSAGVSSNIEVVQAQDSVAGATENYLSALYAFNLAKLQLARATGRAEHSFGTILGLP